MEHRRASTTHGDAFPRQDRRADPGRARREPGNDGHPHPRGAQIEFHDRIKTMPRSPENAENGRLTRAVIPATPVDDTCYLRMTDRHPPPTRSTPTRGELRRRSRPGWQPAITHGAPRHGSTTEPTRAARGDGSTTGTREAPGMVPRQTATPLGARRWFHDRNAPPATMVPRQDQPARGDGSTTGSSREPPGMVPRQGRPPIAVPRHNHLAPRPELVPRQRRGERAPRAGAMR